MAPKDGRVAAPEVAKGAKKGRARPKAAKKPATLKEGRATTATLLEKKLRKKKNQESYKMYIYKALKQIHPEFQVSAKAIEVMNSFIVDCFEKIASKAGSLARNTKKHTIAAFEIQTAVKLLLPGELAKHAVADGTKAVMKFTGNT